MKKRLLLTIFVPPLLTSCGGQIGEKLMEEGIKKFIETLDPSWRLSWFVTKPLDEMNSLIQFFTQFGALIGFAIALWLLIVVLRGHGLSMGAKGILLLASVSAFALAIPIVNIVGMKMMPEEMGLSKMAEYEGWIDLSPNLAKAGTITASAIYAMTIPHVNQLMQMTLTIFFCFTMIGVIGSASPRGFILAGSWLIGPAIFPKVFWVIVTTTAALVEFTGVGPIDDGIVVLRNILTMAVSVIVAAGCYTLPYVVTKTFIWAGEILHLFPPGFKSLNSVAPSERGGLGEALAGFVAGSATSEKSEVDEEETRRKSRDGRSDEHDENGSDAGSTNHQKQLMAPRDDDGDVVDGDVIEGNDPPGGDGSNAGGGIDEGTSSSTTPTPLSSEDGLSSVPEPDMPDSISVPNPDASDALQETQEGDIHRQVTQILHEHDALTTVVEHSIDMQHLIESFGDYDSIPFHTLNRGYDWADDVRQRIEGDITERQAREDG